MRKALKGVTQTSTSSTGSMLSCLLKSPEAVQPVCAEHKSGGKMMEKHCKSVIFHDELFMVLLKLQTGNSCIKSALHRHSFMKRAQSCEALPYGPHQKKKRSRAIFSSGVHRPGYPDFNEAAIYMDSKFALFPLRDCFVVSLLTHLFFLELVRMWL